jgi:hypothetical protein
MDEAQIEDVKLPMEQASDPDTGEYRLNWQLVHGEYEDRSVEVLIMNATETEAKDEAARYSYQVRRFVELEPLESAVIVFDNDGYRLGA